MNTSKNIQGNSANRVLSAGNEVVSRRYWECRCCGQLIVTLAQDSAKDYQCPACKKVGCDHGGRFDEISIQRFCEEANISCT